MTVFSGHEDLQLPGALASQYEIRSCLKYSEQTATYLLRKKETDRLYLLKTASDPVLADLLINENNILHFIHEGEENRITGAFPSPVSLACYLADGTPVDIDSEHDPEQTGTLYYVRTYIEGKTLEELCEMNYKKPGLPLERALDYLIALAELLDFLHTMNPPLIHRDIKPQNVVIDPEGTCHFIDFGISRFYGPEKSSDTFIMGTKLTAPPEQFGYQQTDMRSDLYSLGILLFYCLTGEYEIKDQNLSEFPPILQNIIRKATMFDPEKRYQTVKELLPDLIAARYAYAMPKKKPSRYPKWLLASVLVLLTCTLGFSALFIKQYQENVRLTEELNYFYAKTSEYTFTEPLIEDAVRMQLNNPDGPVTYEDLEKITEIHIFGLQIYSDDSEVWLRGNYPWFYTVEFEESGLYNQKGTISSLDDILNMPNLDTLCLYRQQIEDISILKDTKIQELGLGYNPITDFGVLANNENITYLSLPSTSISDVYVLATMPNLRSLNISNTEIRSINGLENCPLEQLNLYQTFLYDYSQLRRFSTLTELSVDSVTPNQLKMFGNLSLTSLEIHNSDNCTLEDISIFSELTYLHFNGTGTELFRIGTPDLPNLTELDVGKAQMDGFEALSGLSNLETLHIYAADCTNYDGLDQIPKLRIISCTSKQYRAISAQYPESEFIYSYYG